MATVYIPTPLRRLTAGQRQVEASAPTVAALVEELDRRFPGFRAELVDQEGKLHRFVNVYVNDEEIDELQGVDTPLREGDRVAIIPAMAGGALTFTEAQLQRYSRHLILPEIGGRGQRKLLRARVLLIGAGGLGSPAALYLAAAGVGTLGIVEFDTVDPTNLHRQILHGHKDIGRPKIDSARDRLRDVNPDVEVIGHPEAITSENAREIIRQYDIVVNGSDNFATRYLVNDVCFWERKLLVDGSIFKFEGQATVFQPGSGCYRCLFPNPPPAGSVPSCAEAGVLGVLPGIIGCIQATETIKLILGLGEPLIGRLLLFDALAMEFREVRLRRDPECPVCGDHPTITEPIDYVQFCGAPNHEAALIG